MKKSVENLVGPRIHQYMLKHKILEKMHPKSPEEWTAKDASMVTLKSVEIPMPFPGVAPVVGDDSHTKVATDKPDTAAEVPEPSLKRDIDGDSQSGQANKTDPK